MMLPTSHFTTLRNRRVHWRAWGRDDAPIIVMVHGWMDTSFTFQFLVDALGDGWRVLAPDLRGFGQTQWSAENASGYWFHDYIADLDAFLDHVAPDESVNLLGHSLGGNIVCVYAGVRPARVRRVVSLDGFGVPKGDAQSAPDKLTSWLDAVKVGESLRPYTSREAVAQRLQKNDPYLTAQQAMLLASQWAEPLPDGTFQVRADPAHKLPFSTVYRLEESLAIWGRITAPVLWVGAAQSHIAQWLGYGRDDPKEMGANSKHSPEFAARLAAFKDIRFENIDDASHNLHHEKAGVVARLLAGFFTD
jgi:pimeloyl-ACP methyl ester carboxylesterase